MWRNHIYNIVINAFKNVADVAPQLHQLGYRDKVRHRTALPCALPRILFPSDHTPLQTLLIRLSTQLLPGQGMHSPRL